MTMWLSKFTASWPIFNFYDRHDWSTMHNTLFVQIHHYIQICIETTLTCRCHSIVSLTSVFAPLLSLHSTLQLGRRFSSAKAASNCCTVYRIGTMTTMGYETVNPRECTTYQTKITLRRRKSMSRIKLGQRSPSNCVLGRWNSPKSSTTFTEETAGEYAASHLITYCRRRASASSKHGFQTTRPVPARH